MVEYIDREQLLELINEDCKYKNPTNEYTRGCNEVCDWAIKIIKNMPTADVVEVVRCKDCAHYIEMKGFDYKGRKARSCVWHSALRSENDYCSDGIRRSESNGRE